MMDGVKRRKNNMLKRLTVLGILFFITTGCSEFALLMSGSSMAVSQNVYAKAYNASNFITVIATDKDIKTHIYDKVKVANKKSRDLLNVKHWHSPR